MAVYNVHGGHSLVCRGAAALLDEVNEDRKVKNRVMKHMTAQKTREQHRTKTLQRL